MPQDCLQDSSRASGIEYENWDVSIRAEREGSQIHHSQLPPQDFIETDVRIECRGGIGLRIGVVDPIHGGCFEQDVDFQLKRSVRAEATRDRSVS